MTVPRFRRALTIRDREKVREAVMQRELAKAYRRAAAAHVTGHCRRAMEVTGEHPGEARQLHEACGGEQPGGVGCLCICHDVVTGGVVSQSVTLPCPND